MVPGGIRTAGWRGGERRRMERHTPHSHRLHQCGVVENQAPGEQGGHTPRTLGQAWGVEAGRVGRAGNQMEVRERRSKAVDGLRGRCGIAGAAIVAVKMVRPGLDFDKHLKV